MAINPRSLHLVYRVAAAVLLISAIAAGLCPGASASAYTGYPSRLSQAEKKLVVTILLEDSLNSTSAGKPRVLKSVSFDLSQYLDAAGSDGGEAMIEELKQDFQGGERIRFRIENRSKSAVEAALFNINRNGKVSAIYPSQTLEEPLSYSELEAGEVVETKSFAVSAPAGEERFKLLVGRLQLGSLDPNLGISNRRAVSGPKGTASVQSNIASIYTNTGQEGRSIEYYDLALAILRSRNKREPEAEITSLNNRGLAFYKISDYGRAIKDYREALGLLDGAALEQKSQLKHRGVLLNNLGQVYSSLASFDLARRNYEQALSIKRELGDRDGVAIVLNNIATVYSSLNDYKSAERYYLESLAMSKKFSLGSLQAATLGSLAQTYLALNRIREATDYARRSIRLSRGIRNRLSEGLARNNLGSIFLQLKQYEQAIEQYQAAVRLFQRERNRMGQVVAYSNLMFTYEEHQKPLMAIAYGKWAVNILQQIRKESGSLDRDLQRSFIKSRGDTYRELADLLVSKGRIPEAERVLEMLKEEELAQYASRDKAVASVLSKRIDLSDHERRAIEDYAVVAEQITALSRELEELEAERLSLPEDAEFPKQARYDELRAKIASAIQAFAVFERQLGEELGENDVRVKQLGIGLQNKLKSWNSPNTVIISTIVGSGRTHLIVTTTAAQEPHTVTYSEGELDRLILEFRSAITDACACIDPRPAGKRLYDLLIKPIEGDLSGAGAKTLVWSLDGPLRYIPIAALWDGKQYLAERYQNVIVTLAAMSDLSEKRREVAGWRALGAGVSKKRGDEFPALEAVPDELKNVVRQENALNAVDEQGVIPGRRLLDDDFKRSAFERALGRYSVIHIASHFDFRPGEEGASVLLMGDGLLSLKELSSSSTLFNGVELLTLSACNTATGGGRNGTEVEGFGGLAQKQGAKAVLASLWSVADQSTGILMRQFYSKLRDNPRITKAEALRQAQLDLLKGRVTIPTGIDDLRDKNSGGANAVRKADFVPDPKAPRSHPYYWAPFILMGNWK